LNYTGGSLCDPPKSKRALLPLEELASRRISDDDDEDEDEDDPEDAPPKKKPGKGSHERRKSVHISLLCEKDPLASTAIAFVAASEDHCTYFFEARTSAACGGIEAAEQTLGPGGVFGVM
jgi:cation-dependent mannose-6-phosphate receptor